MGATDKRREGREEADIEMTFKQNSALYSVLN